MGVFFKAVFGREKDKKITVFQAASFWDLFTVLWNLIGNSDHLCKIYPYGQT